MSPFEATSTALIKLAAESLTSAPHYTAEQRQTRTEAVVCAIMAFLPSEPVQTMLASQAVGHHLMLLDTFREIDSRVLPDTASARMRMVSATQTRMTLALIRETRAVRRDAQAQARAERAAARSLAAEPPTPAAQPPDQSQPEQPRQPRAAMRPRTEREPANDQTVDDATFEAHVNDYKDALAATLETLEEARALNRPTASRAARFLGQAHPPRRAEARSVIANPA